VRRVALGALVAIVGLGGLLTASGPAVPASGGAPQFLPVPAPASRPGAVVLADGVRIGSLDVGGLSPEEAARFVRLAFRAPLVLSIQGRLVEVSPRRLGAVAYVRGAVGRALRASPGSRVALFVSVRGALVRVLVAKLARRVDRPPTDARVVLRRLQPRVVGGQEGTRLDRVAAMAAIVRALREDRRGPVELPVRSVKPKLTREEIGPVIVIRRESKRLYYYERERLVRVFRVATGQPEYPTPLGSFRIVVKWRGPWWYPPPSPWAQGLKPVPPGPGNPLGTRWMGLSVPAVGIHGTPDAASLGYSASHGCIRMAIPSAEWLFERVEVGTPVFIVPR